MFSMIFSALLIFVLYTLGVLSFFSRESYERLKMKIRTASEGRHIYRSFFSRIYLISSLIALILTFTVVYFFIS
jgi:hypothetical protein